MTARYAAIIISLGQKHPTLVALTGDGGLTGFPLGLEGIEVLFETFFSGFARVDSAADFDNIQNFRTFSG